MRIAAANHCNVLTMLHFSFNDISEISSYLYFSIILCVQRSLHICLNNLEDVIFIVPGIDVVGRSKMMKHKFNAKCIEENELRINNEKLRHWN